MRSSLEIWDMASGQASVVLQTDLLIEAPNWAPAGDALLVNSDGKLLRVPLDNPRLEHLDTGFATACNNDHGYSPDGTRIALTHRTDRGAEIYVMPARGGTPEPATHNAPSWFHGWSPDGGTLTYAAARGGSRVVGIAVLDLATGEEAFLTDGAGVCDGPEFTADGTGILYNCDRTGHAQIWRMDRDGGNAARLYGDRFVNWFPHPSPDGKHVLCLAYPPFTEGHPRDSHVALRLTDAEGKNPVTLAEFNGGQGTLNGPCWAPDGHAFAYVRYGPVR